MDAEPTEPGPPSDASPPDRLRLAGFIVAGVATALVFAVSVTSLGFLWYADTQINKTKVEGLTPEDEPGDPVNVLILGSDTREGLSPEDAALKGAPEDVGGERSDTIILARFDPQRGQAVLVHFPRDLRVEIPGHGVDKINAAYSLGGPDLTVQTISEYAGVPINHYVEVGFVGFRAVVDALGGVKICVDRPMVDVLAELNLPKAGCYNLHGNAALGFVRARNVEGDLIPDFARIARQQQFIRAVMNKVFSVGALWKLPKLVTAAAQNVTTDEDINATDLIDIGSDLRGLAQVDPTGASTVDLRVIPGTTQTIDAISYVVTDQTAVQKFFKRLMKGWGLGDYGTEQTLTPVSPAQIKVRVLHAKSSNKAVQVEDLLRAAGFVVLEGGLAPAKRTQPVLLFKKSAEKRAEVVAGFFPDLPMERGFANVMGDADIVLIVTRKTANAGA